MRSLKPGLGRVFCLAHRPHGIGSDGQGGLGKTIEAGLIRITTPLGVMLQRNTANP
jgi:hypothetical protein